MKIVINTCYGGFGLSNQAIEHYANLKGLKLEQRENPWCDGRYHYYLNGEYFSDHNFERNDPDLIKTIEELGVEKCSNWASDLKIVTIPDDVKWQIQEYDGMEWVAEQHRTWE